MFYCIAFSVFGCFAVLHPAISIYLGKQLKRLLLFILFGKNVGKFIRNAIMWALGLREKRILAECNRNSIVMHTPSVLWQESMRGMMRTRANGETTSYSLYFSFNWRREDKVDLFNPTFYKLRSTQTMLFDNFTVCAFFFVSCAHCRSRTTPAIAQQLLDI